MNILLLEAFYGGSHQTWAEGYSRFSEHQINVLSLPARHWKWRMHGGAISLAKKFLSTSFKPDLVLSTDMVDLSVFVALCRKKLNSIPVALYLHENQLTYPWSPEDRDTDLNRDNHYAFINYSSMLTADAVYFNSRYHRSSFLNALPAFLGQFPDHKETDMIKEIEKKSSVLPLGLDLKKLDNYTTKEKRSPALILWNHRWEYDKNPELFFETLFRLQEEDIPFELAILGQSYPKSPVIFEVARRKLKDRILCFGYQGSFADYARWLWQADILAVTSNQDFFGGSVVEAIYCNCFPILPNRLAFPEHIAREKKAIHLYETEEEYYAKLKLAILNVTSIRNQPLQSDFVSRYDWSILARRYDELFVRLS